MYIPWLVTSPVPQEKEKEKEEQKDLGDGGEINNNKKSKGFPDDVYGINVGLHPQGGFMLPTTSTTMTTISEMDGVLYDI